jgi:hypothetical protein
MGSSQKIMSWMLIRICRIVDSVVHCGPNHVPRSVLILVVPQSLVFTLPYMTSKPHSIIQTTNNLPRLQHQPSIAPSTSFYTFLLASLSGQTIHIFLKQVRHVTQLLVGAIDGISVQRDRNSALGYDVIGSRLQVQYAEYNAMTASNRVQRDKEPMQGYSYLLDSQS